MSNQWLLENLVGKNQQNLLLASLLLSGTIFFGCAKAVDYNLPPALGTTNGHTASERSENAGGVVDGGGGNAVICLKQDGSIRSAQLLDIFEAEKIQGRSIRLNQDPFMTQAQRAFERFSAAGSFFTPLLQELSLEPDFNPVRSTFSKFKIVRGIELKRIDDSHEVFIPAGCSVRQLANYAQDETVTINGDVWDRLDELNRAALVSHELIYKYLRLQGEVDSIRTRKLVGLLFSGYEFSSSRRGLSKTSLFRCERAPKLQNETSVDERDKTSFLLSESVSDTDHLHLVLNFNYLGMQKQFGLSQLAFDVTVGNFNNLVQRASPQLGDFPIQGDDPSLSVIPENVAQRAARITEDKNQLTSEIDTGWRVDLRMLTPDLTNRQYRFVIGYYRDEHPRNPWIYVTCYPYSEKKLTNLVAARMAPRCG